MKNRKKLFCFAIPCLMFTGLITDVNATFLGDEDSETRAPICEPYKYYEPSSSSTQYSYNQEGEFKNTGAQVQSKEVTYSTTYTSSVSTSVSSDLNLIAAKLNVGLQVSAGMSRTVTLTSKFYISPRSVGSYKVGQQRKQTYGYIVTVYDNCSTSQKYVSSNYSFGPYDTYNEYGI